MCIFSGQILYKRDNTLHTFRMNEFAEALYKLTQLAQQNYFEDCDQLCHKYHLPCVIFAYGAKTQIVLKQQIEIDETLDTTIQLILSRLLIGEPASSMLVAGDKPDYDEWAWKFPFFSLVTSNINDVLTTSVDIFKEAFADVVACEILEADFTDYVLMHVFEDWDLDSALDKDMANTYRIPAVLRLCYSQYLTSDGQLTAEANKCIENAILRLESHGMPNRLDSTGLCDRLNELLCGFNENIEISEPLCEYLRQCKSDYEKDTVKTALKPFTDSYQAIRLLAINPKEQDYRENLLTMYDALTCRGGRLP